MYKDKTLKCIGCGKDFLFTAQEQEKNAARHISSPPQLCGDCFADVRARSGVASTSRKETFGGDKQEQPRGSTDGYEPFVFLSYSHKDQALIAPWFDAFREAGISIWYDEGIRPGSEWVEEIIDNLSRASCFIFFVTEHSLASSNCKDELHAAREQKKPFINILLEDIDFSKPEHKWFKFRYSRYQQIAGYAKSRREVIQKVVDAFGFGDEAPIQIPKEEKEPCPDSSSPKPEQKPTEPTERQVETPKRQEDPVSKQPPRPSNTAADSYKNTPIYLGWIYGVFLNLFFKKTAKRFVVKREEIRRNRVLYCDGAATCKGTGGWLFFTEKGLEFYPNGKSRQAMAFVLLFDRIRVVGEKKGGRLTVTTADGRCTEFKVFQCKEWKRHLLSHTQKKTKAT